MADSRSLGLFSCSTKGVRLIRLEKNKISKFRYSLTEHPIIYELKRAVDDAN